MTHMGMYLRKRLLVASCGLGRALLHALKPVPVVGHTHMELDLFRLILNLQRFDQRTLVASHKGRSPLAH